MGIVYGYTRASGLDQNEDRQRAATRRRETGRPYTVRAPRNAGVGADVPAQTGAVRPDTTSRLFHCI